MRIFITCEQAKSILPSGDSIHTFINGGFGLCGADWSREEIVKKLNDSDIIELTGETAKGMHHGMCVYNKDVKYQSELLFIETSDEKLQALEKELGGEGET